MTKYPVHSLPLNGVRELEEVSAPIIQDKQQEEDTAAATPITSSPSTPRKHIPSNNTSEPTIPEPSEEEDPTMDSDPVLPSIRSLEETINVEPITSNPSANDHYLDLRD